MMDGLPEINDALWITLFIIAGVLGYKALIVKMGDKKVAPTYVFVYSIDDESETESKIKYEIGLKSNVVITAIDQEGNSQVLFEKEQEVGNYYLTFDKRNKQSIKISTLHQTIERFL